MKNIKNYINKSIKINESQNVAVNFITDIDKFVNSTLSNLSTFSQSHIDKKDNELHIHFISKDGFENYHIYIFGIDNIHNFGYKFKYLPEETENVFTLIFNHTTLTTSSSIDELDEFIQVKDKKLADSIKGYDGFERGGWDEYFEAIYPINDTTIKYLKDCLTKYCKNIK